MLGGKKPDRSKKDRSGRNLAQYGLYDPSDMNFDSSTNPSMDNDSDLEAELAALAGGGSLKPKRAPKKVIPDVNLDAMVAESMKDIPSDAELSGDDDDPDLLNELSEIAGEEHVEPETSRSPPQPSAASTSDISKLLNERLKMYEEAEKNSKSAGETGRARRFARGIKTLKDLIKQAAKGTPINDEDIPPEVSTGPRNPPQAQAPAEDAAAGSAPDQISSPTRRAPPVPPPAEPASSPDSSPTDEHEQDEVEIVASTPAVQVDQNLLNMLTDRKNEYKVAALKAKKSGDTAAAVRYIKIAKQFDGVIAAVENGQPVDLSRMPGPPSDGPASHEKIEENRIQTDSVPDPQSPTAEAPDASAAAAALPSDDNLIMASSVAEALEQRLEVYKGQESAAKEQGNSSKARRMGRIVKQYEQAIKQHKAGKPIPVDELPTPPGYGPIPVPGGGAPPGSTPAPAPGGGAAVAVPPKPSTQPSPSPPEGRPRTVPKTQPSTSKTTRITGNQVPNSRAEKQMQLLLAKQREFKEAALNAKRKGEIEQAKEFLRTAKGFEPLIEASSCGLPVDLSSLPISPIAKSQLEDEYDVVMADEITEDGDSNGKSEHLDLISRLEAQLTKQLKMCLSTRDHHKALGDVAGTNRFERLALNVTKDLDLVRLAHRTPGAGVPKFHYETKDFSIVKSFTELGDNDLELTIVRGISYTATNPKEIDTYVKFEVPYPQEEPYRDRTVTVKDTNSPEYNATFVIPINRTARACQRVFKRHSVKLEVYSKGGWFRGDTLLGTVSVKLQPLETQCELHDSFDLLDGRKKAGGKLEVRLRLRHPILAQQVEQLHEKWLVIDN